MNIQSVQRLVTKGENQFLEFKKKANFPEKIVKELVAFANSQGGQLLLGVDDDGTVSGTRNIEGEAFVLEKAIETLISPQLIYSKEIIAINAKKGIAVFSIPESQKKPHFVKAESNSQHGIAFVRSGDESIKASREMKEIMRRRLKPRDQRLDYGDKEHKLMQYLETEDSIDLERFAEHANISRQIASKTLIKLVLANILDIEPSASGDKFFRTTVTEI